jgi:hypothetical protein
VPAHGLAARASRASAFGFELARAARAAPAVTLPRAASRQRLRTRYARRRVQRAALSCNRTVASAVRRVIPAEQDRFASERERGGERPADGAAPAQRAEVK